jgi:hypothetical protein
VEHCVGGEKIPSTKVKALRAFERSNGNVGLRWRDSGDMVTEADELARDVGFESGEGCGSRLVTRGRIE